MNLMLITHILTLLLLTLGAVSCLSILQTTTMPINSLKEVRQ